VDEASLKELGLSGLVSAPHLRTLEAWCWERAEATGDARFCGIARALENIAEAWDDRRVLPPVITSELQTAFRIHLPSTLAVSAAEEGAGLARLLREEVADILKTWDGSM
jgi:hypothetical protein